ncbi:F0F1 ATP synthase subunit B [Marinicella sp. S1101]|uniref:F0F1 ATP synthase subunit B n=1 Tax=Marinicella marina TaxID=2996016 RepID=UPI002260B1D1|nr:F0F1 ATP synthase subunit B [Marinicella marina]MCX7554378.1 F0F1 ATP synthase subunit B [Marinicella marina]MDJ1138631.1 F0F1 ATP synthase subunit B [Marinicella marina]
MSLNVTIIIQILAFLAVCWLTMKYIWPQILGAMEEREKKIADGLAAGDRAEKELSQAQAKVDTLIVDAKDQAIHIKDQASQMATKIKDQAKSDALAEKERQLNAAKAEIEQEANRAKEALRQQVSALAIAGTEQLLSKEVDAQKHAELLDDLIKEI